MAKFKAFTLAVNTVYIEYSAMPHKLLAINSRTSLELAGIFVFITILLSNLVVVKFAEGYFGYYDISLGLVNFTPQMYDYVRIAVPVLTMSLIVAIVIWGAMRFGEYMGSLLARGVNIDSTNRTLAYIRQHRKFFVKLGYIVDFTLTVALVMFLSWAAWTTTTNIATTLGKASAEDTTQISSISNKESVIQEIIIYRNDDGIITKTYDTSQSRFLDGYKILPSGEYNVRAIVK